MKKQFVIFSTTELNKINFDEVLETSIDTLRKSLDGTLTFVKWNGTTPASVETLETKSNVYSEEEIKQIIDTPEWNERLK
jgi:hypothetical protein